MPGKKTKRNICILHTNDCGEFISGWWHDYGMIHGMMGVESD